MKTIFRTIFGSHLYGTSTPESDRDYRGVFLPDRRSIILGSVTESTETTTGSPLGKNTADDVDETMFSFRKFVRLVARGDVGAMDMLFAVPLIMDKKIEGTVEVEMYDLWEQREKLFSKNISATLGYCRSQVAKYGIKGERVSDAKYARQLLHDKMQEAELAGRDHRQLKMNDIWDDLNTDRQFIEKTVTKDGNDRDIDHWEVCNRKLPRTVRVTEAAGILDRLIADYGARAMAAERMSGVDWKAVSHAQRITEQAIEFVRDRHITFPRPDAEYLLEIKNGLHEYEPTVRRLESSLNDLERLVKESDLPDEVEEAVINDLVFAAYDRVVTGEDAIGGS